MVRTFCDRCGRVIAGASKLGGATVRAADEHGNEIIKLDFCAFCADWAVNKLLRKALTERHEDEQADGRGLGRAHRQGDGRKGQQRGRARDRHGRLGGGHGGLARDRKGDRNAQERRA